LQLISILQQWHVSDIFVKNLGLIIEFDGTYYHKNIEKDRKRDDDIKECGYKILHIHEKQYRERPRKQIKKCLNFIKEIVKIQE
jgi:very-short-patch-repair endonuclease